MIFISSWFMRIKIEPLLAFKTQSGVQRPACLSRELSGRIIKTSNTCQQHNISEVVSVMTTMRGLTFLLCWLWCVLALCLKRIKLTQKSLLYSFGWKETKHKNRKYMGLLTEGYWGVNRHFVLINAPLIAHSAYHYPACSSVSLEFVLSGGTERKHTMSTLDRLITTHKHRGTLITDSRSFSLSAAELCLLCWYDKVTLRRKLHFWKRSKIYIKNVHHSGLLK